MIPSEFTIDGVPWTVAGCNTMGDREWGETDKTKCRILLSDDLCPAMREVTFWHEVIHAIFSVRDLRLHPVPDPDLAEEEVASILGPALHSFFLENVSMGWRYDPPEIH